MTATVDLITSGSTDPVTGVWTEGTLRWSGPAAVWPLPESLRTVVTTAGQQVTARLYGVELPLAAPEPAVNSDRLVCTAIADGVGDPVMVGKILLIVDATYSAEAWARALTCEER